MTMSPEAESYSLSDPMTVQKLERIYYEVLLKQDFYAILMAVNGLLNSTKTSQGMRSRTISFLAQSQRQAFRSTMAWLYRSYPAGELEL